MDRGVQIRQCFLCLAKGPYLNSRDQHLHVFAVEGVEYKHSEEFILVQA